MADTESTLDPAAVAYARALLRPPVAKDPRWGALAAAAFAALSAMAFAVTMILAPQPEPRRPTTQTESITLSMTPAVR